MIIQPIESFESCFTDAAKAAIGNSSNVTLVAIGAGTVMAMTAYGPCGILYRRAIDFLWHPDPGIDQIFPDVSTAIVAVIADSERRFSELVEIWKRRSRQPITVLEEDSDG
jgi:hypothetical protein